MNRTEITLKTILSAIKHYWKICVITTVIFAIVGAMTGAWYAPKAETTAQGDAQDLVPISYSDIVRDEYYYARCAKLLDNAYSALDGYLEALKKMKGLAADSSILSLYEYSKQLQIADFLPIQGALASDDLYVLPECIPQALTKCKGNLVRLSHMSIVSQINYGFFYRNMMDVFIEQLENEPEKITANAKTMDEMLAKAADHINALQTEIDRIAEEIAIQKNIHIRIDENLSEYTSISDYNQFKIDAKRNTADDDAEKGEIKPVSVLVLHTYRAAGGREAFAAILLTTTLVGVCCGAFWSVCKETAVSQKEKGDA